MANGLVAEDDHSNTRAMCQEWSTRGHLFVGESFQLEFVENFNASPEPSTVRQFQFSSTVFGSFISRDTTPFGASSPASHGHSPESGGGMKRNRVALSNGIRWRIAPEYAANT